MNFAMNSVIINDKVELDSENENSSVEMTNKKTFYVCKQRVITKYYVS